MNPKKDLSVITEVHEADVSALGRPTSDPLFSSRTECPVTSDRSPSSHRTMTSWVRAKVKIRAQRVMHAVDQEILTYGTSNELTDHNNKYKLNINQLITEKSEKRDHFRSIATEDEIQINSERCLLRPGSRFKQVWNPLIALALMYTATMMPFRIAFEEQTFWDFWQVLELGIDGLFTVDIGVNFLSVVVMDDGTVLRGHRAIARSYLKGWFAIDLLACLPFTLLDYYMQKQDQATDAGKYNNAMRLMRLPRLYKLLRVVRIVKAFRHYKSSGLLYSLQDLLQINSRIFKLVKFLLYVMVAVHLMACVWYLTAKLQGLTPDTWVVRYGFDSSSKGEQYLASVYFSITTLVTVGYGDILAKTKIEIAVVIFWMIVGVGFYSFTVGSLSSFLSSIDTLESALALKMAMIQVIAKETGLPKHIRSKVRYAIAYNTSLTGSIWSDKHSLFNELPKKLRFEVATSMYNGVAKDLVFLRNKDQAFINYVMPLLVPMRFGEETILYREGEYADEVFFITFGKVDMLLRKWEIVYKSYIRGSYIGDVEVIHNTKRLATCLCIPGTEVLTVSKVDFLQILDEFPHEKREICRIAANRLHREKLACFELLEMMHLRRVKGNLSSLHGHKQLVTFDKCEFQHWETADEKRAKEIAGISQEMAETPLLVDGLRKSVKEFEEIVKRLPTVECYFPSPSPSHIDP